jgi:hypothetical protein
MLQLCSRATMGVSHVPARRSAQCSVRLTLSLFLPSCLASKAVCISYSLWLSPRAHGEREGRHE